ncbi:MBL fold metallo-hydrolase RNA specificity domain-containing protein [Oceanicaulis alexandrii]|uniref:MBL fold metallo-hydrolase RNA specificity domain-containing protein n=1 Tax=Oceanicaulis alexandrii TaxID=153233 RepID=UPI002354822D|nr:MBL fold metallo-hydrolase [Oceanicaulis alexandrii]
MLTLTCLGGAGTVTGSKHLLTHEGRRILIDCGLFQGLKNLRELNWGPLPVDPSSIDAVVLTHAHLDHCGYLPRLIADGFEGPVFATPATCDVAELILRDSGYLQEKDAEYANRKGFSRHSPALPLYDLEQAEQSLDHFTPTEFGDVTTLPGGAKLLFRRAGHILGAATAEIEWGGRRIVFSGDLGRYGDGMMVDPEPVERADYVVIESTYGDRLHAPGDPIEQLGKIIERTLKRGGNVLIPSFAVGRAQLLLYYLWRLKQAGRLKSVPIYLDSPMAIDATGLLHAHIDDHRLDRDSCRKMCAIAEYTRSVDQSKAVTASPYPKVVISASGMVTGGRVLHHLKALGGDHRNTILFAGYQAAGTRGRALLNGKREVKIHGEWIAIEAEIADLSQLSAHADSDELIRWLSGFKTAPKEVFVVHGEPESSDALRVRIKREFGWDARAPRQDQVFEL